MNETHYFPNATYFEGYIPRRQVQKKTIGKKFGVALRS